MTIDKILLNVIVLITITLLYAYGLRSLIDAAKKVHERIDELESKVKLTKNKADLELYWEELKIINNDCFHRTLSSRIRELKAIIETKYEFLAND